MSHATDRDSAAWLEAASARVSEAFREAQADGSHYAEVVLPPGPPGGVILPVVAEGEPKFTLVISQASGDESDTQWGTQRP